MFGFKKAVAVAEVVSVECGTCNFEYANDYGIVLDSGEFFCLCCIYDSFNVTTYPKK